MTQHDLFNVFLVLNGKEFLGRGICYGRLTKWTPGERQIVRAAVACVNDPSSDLEDSYRYNFSDWRFLFTDELANFVNEPEWVLMADAAGIDVFSDEFEYGFLLRPNRNAPGMYWIRRPISDPKRPGR